MRTQGSRLFRCCRETAHNLPTRGKTKVIDIRDVEYVNRFFTMSLHPHWRGFTNPPKLRPSLRFSQRRSTRALRTLIVCSRHSHATFQPGEMQTCPYPRTPCGPAGLSQNARTVLEKRYLIKDADGQADRDAGGDVLARGDGRRRGGSRGTARREDAGAGGGGGVLRADDAAPLRAELADAHERRPSARPALGVLRAARRGRAVQRAERHLRHAARRWRSSIRAAAAPGFSLLAPAREGLDGALDDRRRERARSRS